MAHRLDSLTHFYDTERRAASLQQLSFLFYLRWRQPAACPISDRSCWIAFVSFVLQFSKLYLKISVAVYMPANLCVVTEIELSLSAHVIYVTCTCFFHPRQLHLIMHSAHVRYSTRYSSIFNLQSFIE